MTRGVKRFTELRAWQACDVFKKAVYRLCEGEGISRDFARRRTEPEHRTELGIELETELEIEHEPSTENPEA